MTPRGLPGGHVPSGVNAMPDWLAWTFTIGFGALNVYQLFQYLIDRKVRDANKKHILAMKHSLQSLRDMCAEAIDKQEVIKSEATRQWARQVSWGLHMIQHHIDAVLETQGGVPEEKG